VTETAAYIHGTSPGEQARLAALNDLLEDACLRQLGLSGGEKVLDIGCGLGQFSRAMARCLGPGGRVLGVERSPEQLAEARRRAEEAGEGGLVELRAGDALALPLGAGERGSVDVAHARFVLEHVRDPLAVVRGMVAAVRPGGRVVLADDDHDVLRLWPEPAGFGALWQAYVRSYDRLGNDPYVGRRLVALLHDAGAQPRYNTWIFFGACAGQPAFAPLVTNLANILAGASATIVSLDLLPQKSVTDALAALHAWGSRPESALWYAVCWAEGVRPEK
jgi:SAM-dependent methyltransferase